MPGFKTVVLPLAAMLAIGAGPARENLAALAPGSAEIDLRTALQVGQYRVSHYLVDKYHGRFEESFRQREHRPPTTEERKTWLELFLARQVVVAHAIQAGYGRHPEVVRMVDRMERHMLSQSGDPFYRPAAKAPPPSPATIALVHRRSRTVTDAVVARFDDEASAHAHIGADFLQCTHEEQTRRILAASARDDVQFVEGPLSWPYAPFLEIGEVIALSPPGRWIQHREPGFGLYCVLVRNVRPPAGGLEAAGDSVASYILQIENQIAQRRADRARLESASFSLERGTVRSAVALWAGLSSDRNELPELPDTGFAALPLARYQISGQAMTVTLDAFRRHFNERFVRHLPRQPAELGKSVEEMVLGELNLHAARNDGIDLLPKFLEDRQGFAGFQALDLFEREKLAPSIVISQAQIGQYYRDHLPEYLRVTRVKGRWLEFSTAAEAIQWLQKDSQPDSTHAPVAPLREQSRELRLEAPPPELGRFQTLIFNGPAGAKAGPFPHGATHVVFIKQADVTREPPPLPAVSDAIRHTLTRTAIDQKELSLAAELGAGSHIEETVEWSRYGVPRRDVNLPWAR